MYSSAKDGQMTTPELSAPPAGPWNQPKSRRSSGPNQMGMVVVIFGSKAWESRCLHAREFLGK